MQNNMSESQGFLYYAIFILGDVNDVFLKFQTLIVHYWYIRKQLAFRY